MVPRTGREWAAAAVLLATALAGGPVRAGDEPPPAGGGALRLSADPPRLVLGRDAGAELRISAPPEVEELAVTASVGRVESLRRLPGGGFTVRYRPPAERIPQVAIVSAVAAGRGDGWLAIPLSGQGAARVRGDPGENVSLRIGDRTFGPRRVRADGVAVIPVVVPPGVREAHSGFTPVDLHVPESTLVHAVLERTTFQADRREVLPFLAYVVAPHGAARRGDVPTVELSRGTATLSAREPGAFEGTWTLPPGPAGEERLVVRLPSLPASRVVLRAQGTAGAPASIAVSFDRQELVAGEEVLVTARVLDAAGNPAPAPVELEADAGSLSPSEEAGPAAIAARLRAPPRFEERRAVTVHASVPEAGISGARALALESGPAASAAFSPARRVVRADGQAEVVFALVVRDRFENPVSSLPAFTASRGRVLGIEEAGAGRWRVRYRADAVTAPAEERLVAEVGSARGEAELLLAPPGRELSVLVAAGGAAALGGSGWGPRVALAGERRWLGAVRLLPSVDAAWRLELEGMGLRRERRAAGGPGAGAVGGDDWAVALLAGAALRRELRHGAEAWGSLTAGLLVVSAEDDGGRDEHGVAPALRLALGLGLPIGRSVPFLEAAFLGAAPAPSGSLGALQLSAGIRFDLGGMRWRRSSSSTTSP
jgi:hypothetical protein